MNSSSNRLLTFVVILIILVLLILALFYLPFLGGLRSWWGMVSAPYAVREAGYLGYEEDKGVLYTIGMFGVEKRTFGEYSLVDYVRQDTSEVVILKAPSGTYNVYDITEGRLIALTVDGREKNSLDISPDGSEIVYAVKARTIPHGTNGRGPREGDVPYDLREWDVEVIDRALESVSLIGPGNHPRFYKKGLFYPIPGGFIYRIGGHDGYNETDEGSAVNDVSAYRVVEVTALTDGGLYMFPNLVASAYDTLMITSLSPITFVEAPENPLPVPEGTYDLLVSGATQFVLGSYGEGTGVYRLKNGKTESLFTFPEGYLLDRFTRIR